MQKVSYQSQDCAEVLDTVWIEYFHTDTNGVSIATSPAATYNEYVTLPIVIKYRGVELKKDHWYEAQQSAVYLPAKNKQRLVIQFERETGFSLSEKAIVNLLQKK